MDMFQRKKMESERAAAEQENPTLSPIITPPQPTIVQPTIQPTPAPRKKEDDEEMESERTNAEEMEDNASPSSSVTPPQAAIVQPTIQPSPAPRKKGDDEKMESERAYEEEIELNAPTDLKKKKGKVSRTLKYLKKNFKKEKKQNGTKRLLTGNQTERKKKLKKREKKIKNENNE